ncbi:MAG: 3-dehydroquinate synthase [Proteobacteria bacterium]|nr:3-dehydroquinate synthase [Pseudomonadota bacterium]MDA1132518.1 3-dehydroquinate synthase [Pseudomonadota bacterium]
MSVFGTVTVPLGDRAYEVVVGTGLIAAAPEHLRDIFARPRTAVVTDARVAGLHLPALRTGLKAAGIEAAVITVAGGEASKEFATLERVLDELLDARIERTDTICALGGGVVGDLCGFAAAILRRGTGVVQIPTTLLAQVDAAIGGKTGINTRHGKNLVGAFHQPRRVLADISALATLPPRELLAGYAEVVKYGLLGDAALFDWLEANGPKLIAGDAAARSYAVLASARAKAEIVAGDEREAGRRALLNLGHTLGHALEAELGYDGRLLHGEAVAAGIGLAFDLAVRIGACPPEDAARVRRHLRLVGLPAGLPAVAEWDPVRLLHHMGQDKKVRDGTMTFVLPRRIGQAFLSRDVAEADVLGVLEAEAAA